MKRKHLLLVMLIGSIFVAGGCKSTPECDPVVIVSNTDYTSAPETVPFNEIHSVFAENYSGADLSIALRDELVSRMQEKAENIGEDAAVLYQCIRATYTEWNERPYRIPCYAEKCMYQDQSAWAIAFNRANSFEETSLEHFDLFFVSYFSYDTLYHTGCFATD
ncbi:MAG: hypothetical protein JSV53_07830 [candidate division WOR-3 bacterium]|nr:MAG: hypothetical protein JSV53_07830 [candidate division WOR-3 bacterium]